MMRATLKLLGLLAALASTTSYAGSVSAEPKPGTGRFERGGGDSLEWKPHWKRFTAGNAALTGIAFTSLVTAYAIGPNEEEPWTRRFDFDESARDVLRAPSRRVRLLAEDTSDVTLAITASYPVLVDSLIVAAWYRDSPDVALQLALISSEAMVFSTAIQALTNLASGRERPYGRTCGTEIDARASDCVNDNRYRSMFSGHTSLSFTAAAVTCVHHTQLPLYGREASAAVPCAAGFTLAATTGAMRIVSDYHYLSDVLIGAVVGTGVGITVPLVLHYKDKPGGKIEPKPDAVSVGVAPTPGGVLVWGAF